MIKAYIDAATKGNPGPSGGGILVVSEKKQMQAAFPLAILTNHQAEFAACSHLLDYLMAQNWTDQIVLIYTDSKILAQTIEKRYTKNPDFKPYLTEIETKLAAFSQVIFKWIPETKNKGADHLARQGLQKALNSQNR